MINENDHINPYKKSNWKKKKKKKEIIMLLIICALIKTTSVEILKILITIMVMVKVIT